MQQHQNDKKEDTLLEQLLKRDLGASGISEEVADKIWKWYNPPELNEGTFKKQ